MGSVVQRDGKRVPILMKNVQYVAELYYNLLSIPIALKEDIYLLGNLKMTIILEAGKEYIFDRQIKSGNGFLFVMMIANRDDHNTARRRGPVR